MAAVVTVAKGNDSKAGFELLWQMDEESERLSLIRADHAYRENSRWRRPTTTIR